MNDGIRLNWCSSHVLDEIKLLRCQFASVTTLVMIMQMAFSSTVIAFIFAILISQHLIKLSIINFSSFFFVCLIYQLDLFVIDIVNETLSLVSAQVLFFVFSTSKLGVDFILL